MDAQDTLWSQVDEYLNGLLVGHDAALEQALRDSAAAGLPAINVAPNQGKLLHLLARSISARRVLEIGTLGGYSTIWLARALPPDGNIVTLEYEQKHADVARRNLDRAGLKNRVELVVGSALELLPTIHARHDQPFDLVFIDADKPSNPAYFEWALKLTRPGSLIIIDNVVRKGKVIDASSTDPSILGTRRCLEMISREPRVTATAFQTVGSKEYDGMLMALVTG